MMLNFKSILILGIDVGPDNFDHSLVERIIVRARRPDSNPCVAPGSQALKASLFGHFREEGLLSLIFKSEQIALTL